jgi:hypothetical protein
MSRRRRQQGPQRGPRLAGAAAGQRWLLHCNASGGSGGGLGRGEWQQRRNLWEGVAECGA